jgi:hypothetical protein
MGVRECEAGGGREGWVRVSEDSDGEDSDGEDSDGEDSDGEDWRREKAGLVSRERPDTSECSAPPPPHARTCAREGVVWY